MAATTASSLERLRREMGISQRQMLKVIGANPHSLQYFHDDIHTPSGFIRLALDLRAAYDYWQTEVVTNDRRMLSLISEQGTILHCPASYATDWRHRPKYGPLAKVFLAWVNERQGKHYDPLLLTLIEQGECI